jgi:hypothetical protein
MRLPILTSAAVSGRPCVIAIFVTAHVLLAGMQSTSRYAIEPRAIATIGRARQEQAGNPQGTQRNGPSNSQPDGQVGRSQEGPQRGQAVGPILSSAAPSRLGRGQTVSLTGLFPQTPSNLYYVYVGAPQRPPLWIDTIPVRTTDGVTLSFIVPLNLPLGTYVLQVDPASPTSSTAVGAGRPSGRRGDDQDHPDAAGSPERSVATDVLPSRRQEAGHARHHR